MKRFLFVSLILCSLLLTACHATSIGVIGGADGPTSIIVSETKENAERSYDVVQYFSEIYVDERKLPMLDIDIENPFVSDDRTLILEDNIDNKPELTIYEYYHHLISGSFENAKEFIIDESLLAATEAYENNFKEGIYYSQIAIDEIDLVDQDDLDEITFENKQAIIQLLHDLNMKEFAIVEAEITIKHNQKTLDMVSQVGNREVTRYFVLGKQDDFYKIIEVFWEGFMND